MKILVVEDSERLRRSLAVGFRGAGIIADFAADGLQGLELARQSDYEVIVLDMMLPGISGSVLLERLRASEGEARVLILSARDQVEDRVSGLNLGADDYLVKPFSFDELVARVRALGRRRHDRSTAVLSVGELEVDTTRREVRFAGRPVPVTATEQAALEALVLRRGRVIAKRDLIDILHPADEAVTDNSIEVLISSLRKKLRAAGAPSLVLTRRGYGYLIE